AARRRLSRRALPRGLAGDEPLDAAAARRRADARRHDRLRARPRHARRRRDGQLARRPRRARQVAVRLPARVPRLPAAALDPSPGARRGAERARAREHPDRRRVHEVGAVMYLREGKRPTSSPEFQLRVAVLTGIALAMFLIIFFRLWYVEVLQGDKYAAE